MGISDYLTCLWRNLYAGQEATVRTRHATTDWFQVRKGVCQGYILSPCLINLCVEYIMWNARPYEVQARIKIAGRNINDLRYADDTTLMVESEELKSLLMKVKSESEVTQSCPTLHNAMDCSLPGSSIHGIFQARVLKWAYVGETTVIAESEGGIKEPLDESERGERKRWLKTTFRKQS